MTKTTDLNTKISDALWGANGVFDSVEIELNRAMGKHSFKATPMNPNKSMSDSYIILAEEVGEVAKAILEGEHLEEELVQVAAMATAMVMSIRWSKRGETLGSLTGTTMTGEIPVIPRGMNELS